jgi:hypothetical protein
VRRVSVSLSMRRSGKERRVSGFLATGIHSMGIEMVPGARIELATPAFSGRRSTTELPRHGGVC